MSSSVSMIEMLSVTGEIIGDFADPESLKFAPASIVNSLRASFEEKHRVLSKSKFLAEHACTNYCRANLVLLSDAYYHQVLDYMRTSIVRMEFERASARTRAERYRSTRDMTKFRAAMAGLIEIHALYTAHKTYNLR